MTVIHADAMGEGQRGRDRLSILDIWVDQVTMDDALARVTTYIETGIRPHTIFAVNPEKNFSVPKNRHLYDSFRTADLLIPDGIGVVLAARILYGVKLSRVPGVELMHNICRLAAGRGYGVFLYGAREDVSVAACSRLEALYPGLRVVGRANGYVVDADMASLVADINRSGAHILFLALGSPKQEMWLAEWAERLDTVRICQGVGGSLDTVAGRVKRAPEAWCRHNVEWLYRLLAEPKRIGRQKVLPLFAAKVMTAKMRSLMRVWN